MVSLSMMRLGSKMPKVLHVIFDLCLPIAADCQFMPVIQAQSWRRSCNFGQTNAVACLECLCSVWPEGIEYVQNIFAAIVSCKWSLILHSMLAGEEPPLSR